MTSKPSAFSTTSKVELAAFIVHRFQIRDARSHGEAGKSEQFLAMALQTLSHLEKNE